MAETLSTGIGEKRYPGTYSCVDQSPVTLPTECCPILMFGPMLATGTATPDVPIEVIGGQANTLFGMGSVAAQMANQVFNCCPDAQLTFVPQENKGLAPNLTEWRFQFVGVASESGSITLQIGNDLVVVPIPSGTGPVANASEAALEIGALPSATATSAGGLTSVFSTNGGAFVACMPVRVYDDSDLPEGVTVVATLITEGSGVYNVEPGLDAIDGCCYDFIVSPYNDPLNLRRLNDYLNFTAWACGCVQGGHFFFHDKGTFGELCDKYDGANYRNGSVRACCEEDLTPWVALAGEVASNYCAACENPSQSWVGNKLGIACTSGDCIDTCWTKAEREALSQKGIGTYKCGADGYVLADDTTMAKDENGDPDPRWGYPQLGMQTMRVVRWLENLESERYANTTIVRNANESIQRGAITDTATPAAIANEIFAEFRNEFDAFIVDVSDQDLRDVICTFVDTRDPSCLGIVLNANFVSSLRRFKNRVNPTVGVNFV